MGTVSFGAAGAGRARAPRRQDTVPAVFLGLFLLALGGLFLATINWNGARLHLAARAWPVAQARVLSVSLAEERISGDRGVETELVLKASYEFEVDGERFVGSRIRLSDRARPHDRELMALFGRLNFARLTDRTVPVSYDPVDPAHALLDTGFSWKPAALRAGLGLVALSLGLVLAGGAFGKGRKPSLL